MQRYRITNAAKVGKELSDAHYAASEAVARVLPLVPPAATAERATLQKLRDSLIGFSAGWYVAKPPTEVLEALCWIVEQAQARATENDFNTAREALAEHDAIAFVTDWLESFDLDVTAIRGAEMDADARAAYAKQAATEYNDSETARRIAEHGATVAAAMAHFAMSPETWAVQTPQTQTIMMGAYEAYQDSLR